MVAIEVKSSRRFRPEFASGIRALRAGIPSTKGYSVYRAEAEMEVDGARVLPLELFLSSGFSRRLIP